jgi:hypothetical protein
MLDVIRNTASFTATATLAQFLFVKLDSAAKIVVTTLGGSAIGVVQDKPAAGEVGSVALFGSITKVMSAGTIAQGANVSCDATGKAIPSVSGDFILGVNAGPAVTTGQLALVLFQPLGSKM